MIITHTDIYRFSIPMHPFTIATGTMHYAQNIFIRIYDDSGIYGVGECSAFPMIVGETQDTCFALAKDFAALWKGREAAFIPERMAELDAFIAFNSTVKSAFDMALYDLAAKTAGQPLYRYLGGEAALPLETDITVGIDAPEAMAQQALAFKQKGFRIIKIKLGKSPIDDVERVKQIRIAVGSNIRLRIDANQGWDFDGSVFALQQAGQYDIEFCEQPMRRWLDYRLPELRALSPVKLMADESAFNHYDAERLIDAGACDFVNIKLAKSGGILEATNINRICAQRRVPCMMGGMLESRIALSAFAHFALANPNIVFYDMDTCLLGQQADPVTGGARYRDGYVELPDAIGIGADADESFLSGMEWVSI